MGRIGKLVLKDQNIARKFGYLHPDIIRLIDYLLDTLKDDSLEDNDIDQYAHAIQISVRNSPNWFPYSCTCYIVRSEQRAYNTIDNQSGVHIELETSKNEVIDIRFPSHMMFINKKGMVSMSHKKLLVASALYLNYYSEYSKVGDVLGHSSIPLVLRRLDKTTDDNIIFGYMRWIGSDKYDEVISACQEKQHPDLLMRILRILEERGLRYEQKLRL